MANYVNMMDLIRNNDPVKNCWENRQIAFSQTGGSTLASSSQEPAGFEGNELVQNDGKTIGTVHAIGSTPVLRFNMPSKNNRTYKK